MNPFFNIYIGPMFGAKTTRLLADVDRLKYKGRNIIAFKPDIDKRYAEDKISSHNNGTIEAHSISSAECIYNILDSHKTPADTIAVDDQIT